MQTLSPIRPARCRAAVVAAVFMWLAGLGVAPPFASDEAPAKPDKLSAARTQIAAKNWPAAVQELKRVNEPGSATGTT